MVLKQQLWKTKLYFIVVIINNQVAVYVTRIM